MNAKIITFLGIGALVIVGGLLFFVRMSQSEKPKVVVAPEPVSQEVPVPVAPAPIVPETVNTSTTTESSSTSHTTPPVKSPSKPVTSVTKNIVIQNYAFVPAVYKVQKGTTVVWTNKDIARHTVTGDSGGPSSAFFGTNETYSYTYTKAGTYPYHCEPHPYMTGKIIVTE